MLSKEITKARKEIIRNRKSETNDHLVCVTKGKMILMNEKNLKLMMRGNSVQVDYAWNYRGESVSPSDLQTFSYQ